MKTALSIALSTALVSVSALAMESPRFYDRKGEGWFWYEPEPVAPPPEPPREPEPVAVLPTPVPQPAPAAMAAPSVFSAAWFKDNLPKYRDAAWNNPTIENVRAFLYLQRFAIDRSEQVADATELAVVGDPFLDEISRRPGSTFAAQNIDRQAGAAKSQLIAEVAERAGVFFFFKSDCPQCELQAPLLKALEGEGFTIVPISVDGKALPNSPFPDFKVDAGHAQRLGVQTYPALFLASASGEFAALGQSTMSLPELEHRILVSARRANWITDEAFNRTRPVLNYDNNLAERLSDSGSREELSLDPATGFIEPGVLMDYMRRSLGGQ